VLAAAERLFAERGATEVSMEDIARAAGVGKGTLYRRYPDRAALAVALLDEHERRLQQQLLDGPPPLGPGAPPARRLAAFYAAMVELLEQHRDLSLVAETGAARYRTGAYAFWRAHVHALLVEADVNDPDGVLAELLLAPLAVDLQQRLRSRGAGTADLAAALGVLAQRVLAPAGPP
jgi:AcrR family transcriptional regulator